MNIQDIPSYSTRKPKREYGKEFLHHLTKNPFLEGMKAPFQITGSAISGFIEGAEEGGEFRQEAIEADQAYGSKVTQVFGAGTKPWTKAISSGFGTLISEVGQEAAPQFSEDTKKFVAGKVSAFAQTPEGRQIIETGGDIIEGYKAWANENPEASRNLEAFGGIAELGLELVGLGTGKRIAKAGVTKTGAALEKTGEIIKDVEFPEVKVPIGLKDVFKPSVVVDKTIEGATKVAGAVQKIPEKIGETVKGSVTRNLERMAKEIPEKAKEKMLDLYKRGIVPGVKKKKKTIANIKEIGEAVKRVVPTLSVKYDPVDIDDFANAISKEKIDIYKGIEEGLGAVKSKVNTVKIVDELKTLLKSERADLSEDLRRAIQKSLDNFIDEKGVAKKISPNGSQQIIADIHAELQSFYRGSTSGTNADVIVKNLILNNLKKDLDDLVEKAGGEFKALKAQYADLKKLEDDVVHRAVFEAQKGGGLGDLTDILSAGDIIGGSLGSNPAFLAKGVGQYFTKEVIKSLNDKNELIRQMFILGKNLPSDVPKKSVSNKQSLPKSKQSYTKDKKIEKKSKAEETLEELEKAPKTKKIAKAIKMLKKGKTSGKLEGMDDLETEAKDFYRNLEAFKGSKIDIKKFRRSIASFEEQLKKANTAQDRKLLRRVNEITDSLKDTNAKQTLRELKELKQTTKTTEKTQ